MRCLAPFQFARGSIVLLVTSLLAASAAWAAEAKPPRDSKLHAEIAEAIRAATEKTPGRSVSVGIIENGQLIAAASDFRLWIVIENPVNPSTPRTSGAPDPVSQKWYTS